MAAFTRDLAAFWRSPKELFLKITVIIGLMLHMSFLISLDTGCWNRYFHAGLYKTTQAVDFFAVYIAGHELCRWRSIYPVAKGIEDGRDTYKLKAYMPQDESLPERCTPFRYLPTASYVAVALNKLEPWKAYHLWLILQEILFFISIIILGYHFRSIRAMHIAAAFYFFFFPWYPEIFIGQHNFLQSILILCMLLSAGSGKPGRALGWWITSILWKINTAICLPAFIRWYKWKAIIWVAVIIMVTCGPYFLIHSKDALKFLAMNFRSLDCPYSGNHGLQGLIAKILIKYGYDEHSRTRAVFYIISISSFILISLASTIFARRDRFAECLCLWITTFFLIYSDVWEHHLLMLLPVVVYLYLKRPGRFLWLTWMLLAMPTTFILLYDNFRSIMDAGLPVNGIDATNFWNVWHFTYVKPAGLILLYAYCIYMTVSRIKQKRDG